MGNAGIRKQFELRLIKEMHPVFGELVADLSQQKNLRADWLTAVLLPTKYRQNIF